METNPFTPKRLLSFVTRKHGGKCPLTQEGQEVLQLITLISGSEGGLVYQLDESLLHKSDESLNYIGQVLVALISYYLGGSNLADMVLFKVIGDKIDVRIGFLSQETAEKFAEFMRMIIQQGEFLN